MIKCQQPTLAQNWLSENILNTIYSTEFSENRDSSTTDSRYIVITHTQYHMWQPENYNIGQTTCNILTQQVTHGIPIGHVTLGAIILTIIPAPYHWEKSLQFIWWSGICRFEHQAPSISLMGTRSSNELQRHDYMTGYQDSTIAPAIATRGTFINMDQL